MAVTLPGAAVLLAVALSPSAQARNQGARNKLERFLTPGTPRTIQFVVRRGFGTP